MGSSLARKALRSSSQSKEWTGGEKASPDCGVASSLSLGQVNRLLARIPCPTVFWDWDRVAGLVFCSGTPE